MKEEWLLGRDWCGDVFLDGERISSDCLAVLMRGERPVAVRLGVRVSGRLIVRPRCDTAMTEVRTGEVRLERVRRRTPEEQALLHWSRRW